MALFSGPHEQNGCFMVEIRFKDMFTIRNRFRLRLGLDIDIDIVEVMFMDRVWHFLHFILRCEAMTHTCSQHVALDLLIFGFRFGLKMPPKKT